TEPEATPRTPSPAARRPPGIVEARGAADTRIRLGSEPHRDGPRERLGDEDRRLHASQVGMHERLQLVVTELVIQRIRDDLRANVRAERTQEAREELTLRVTG